MDSSLRRNHGEGLDSTFDKAAIFLKPSMDRMEDGSARLTPT
jgi:hypothetical protein